MPSDNPNVNGNGDAIYLLKGKYSVPFSALPENVVREACRRAFSHVLSNEVSSRVGNEIKRREEDNEPALDETELDSFRAELIADHLASFVDGTWGTSTRGPTGPRVPPVESEYNRLVRAEVKAILDKQIKAPNAFGAYDKENKTWTWQVNGQVVSRTLDAAVANFNSSPRNATRRDELMEQAKKAVAVKESEAASRKAALSATVEELGI